MQWHSPLALLLLLLVPVVAYVMLRKKGVAAITFSSLADVGSCIISWRQKLRPILVVARIVCLVLLIIALARPRKGTIISEVSTEGVAIEVVVDRSGSMAAEMDYFGEKVSRLDTVKKVLLDFVQGGEKDLSGRGGDLIGLITFAQYADTVCPMVLGHNVLFEFLKTTKIALRNDDGTAIGDAIALAAARLKKAEEEILHRKAKLRVNGKSDDNADFKIKSKIIILLTDGQNNAGQYSPSAAAELARGWGIKIYTIGIGPTEAYTTMQTPMGTYKVPTAQVLDEPLLRSIAEKTGGFYGRAGDAKALEEIVEKIDELEKTKVKSVQYTQYAERFGLWAIVALILLGGEMLAGCTIFRKIP